MSDNIISPRPLTPYQKKIMKMRDVYMVCAALDDEGSFSVVRHWSRSWQYPKRWCYTYEDALKKCGESNKSRKFNHYKYIRAQFGTDFLNWVNERAYKAISHTAEWLFAGKQYTTEELYLEYDRLQAQNGNKEHSGVVPCELPPLADDLLHIELTEK